MFFLLACRAGGQSLGLSFRKARISRRSRRFWMTVRMMITAKNRTTMLVDIGKATGMPMMKTIAPRRPPPIIAAIPPSKAMAKTVAIMMEAILFMTDQTGRKSISYSGW